MLLLVKSN